MISERLYSFIVIGFYGILEPELELFEINQMVHFKGFLITFYYEKTIFRDRG